jgi:hypothetical protein
VILWLLIAVVKAERQDDTLVPEALAASAHTVKSIPTTATKGNPAELAQSVKEDDEKYRTQGTNDDVGGKYKR